jgi:hypothetical protein
MPLFHFMDLMQADRSLPVMSRSYQPPSCVLDTEELSVSAFLKQERVVGDAQVKMLPSPIVALMIGLSAVAFLGISTAYPHDPKRPELDGWFKSLKNKAGEPCCDAGDGQHAEAEWDMARGGYKVLLKHPHRPNEPGQWFDVPYSAVIDQPNVSGIAMVWWWPSYGIDGRMTPMWRCFIAGAGG